MPYDFYDPETLKRLEEIMRGLSGGHDGGDWLSNLFQGIQVGEQIEPPDQRRDTEQNKQLDGTAIANTAFLEAANEGKQQFLQQQAAEQEAARQAEAARQEAIREVLAQPQQPFGNSQVVRMAHSPAGAGTPPPTENKGSESATPQEPPQVQNTQEQQPEDNMQQIADMQKTTQEMIRAANPQNNKDESSDATKNVEAMLDQVIAQREPQQNDNQKGQWKHPELFPYAPPQADAMTSTALALNEEIINAKSLYDNAPKIVEMYNNDPNNVKNKRTTTVEEIQKLAHNKAENARMLAEAAGIDLSMVGAEGTDVNLETAINNLAKQKTKEMNSIYSGGEFAMSPEEYNQRKFEELIGQGFTHREARDMAARMTQKYGWQKSAQTQNLYRNYGHTGNYTNAYGNDALTAMATVDPATAKILSELFPSFKDLNLRQEQNSDAARLQQEKFWDKYLTYAFLEAGKNNDVARDTTKHAINKGFDFKLEQAGKDNDEVRARDRTQWNFAESLRQDDVKYQRALALINELPEELRKPALAALHNIRNSSGTGKDTLTNVKTIADMINNQIKTLQARQKAIVDGLPDKTVDGYSSEKSTLNDDINKDARAQYDAIQQQIDKLTKDYGDIIGAAEGLVFGEQEDNAEHFTGNWEHDLPLLQSAVKQAQTAGKSWQEIHENMFVLLVQDGYSPQDALTALGTPDSFAKVLLEKYKNS